MEVSVGKWEEKVSKLMSQFGEKLGDRIKIAIFTNMLPTTLQAHVYTDVQDGAKYEDVRNRIFALTSNKVAAAAGPSPMDVGQVHNWGDDQSHDQGEYEVDAVSMNTQCWKCGGV